MSRFTKLYHWPYLYLSSDMQLLMGSLLYLHEGVQNSTYSFLFEESSWAEICDIFTRDACGLLGLSVESPLSVGFVALYLCGVSSRGLSEDWFCFQFFAVFSLYYPLCGIA